MYRTAQRTVIGTAARLAVASVLTVAYGMHLQPASASDSTPACDGVAATIVGGHRGEGPGHYYLPTVLGNVPDGARLLKEEIFGPVAPITSFSDEDEVLAQANDTEFGLVAYMYTRDMKRAFRMMEKLEYGMVGVNQGLVSNPSAPFGGIKHSGFGREGGYEGIEEYLEMKYCAVNV